MDLQDRQFIVGIDLGTTNSAVSWVDLRAGAASGAPIGVFRVPQLVAPGEVSPLLPVLPSFLYLPSAYELPDDSIRLPWAGPERRVVGVLARDHGAGVPARLVSSAKSWLCHGGVDRRAKILPWGAAGEIRKVSPIEATAAYLDHIRRAWNHARQDEDLHLEHQIVVLTVPASFDEVARDLTVEAARMAGLPDIVLLEEPVAAFYSWLTRHETDWDRHVRPGELILVCDVGGGTTDFTLISLQPSEGGPRFERIAVGDHLILGGDNMDLALARGIEVGLGKGAGGFGGDRWKALCHQCRQAKEAILDGADDRRRITLVGEGSRLIAGTLTADLDRRALEETVLEGFFPLLERDAAPPPTARRGIAEFGLPYEPDPAITRHLGRFLDRHRADVAAALGRSDPAPDVILFNGGALKPAAVQARIRAAVGKWFGRCAAELPRVLENPAPDLAVALGAAYYGRVKIGQGVRVGSGSARSYYLGISRENPQAGAPAGRQAICLVERGLQEGSRIRLEDRKFEVLANQPVVFDLFSSSFRSGDRVGDILSVDDSLTPLPPIQTVVEFGRKGRQAAIPVHLEAEFTEIGTLALWCRSTATPHRWQLQFQLRRTEAAPETLDRAVLENMAVAGVLELVKAGLAPSADPRRLDSLVRDIAEEVGRERDQWPLALIRTMADTLLDMVDARRSGAAHEIRWLNLTGFCLRPGFGDAFDPARIQRLMRIYPKGPVFAGNAQVRAEWYILWRRVAGGLKAGQQRQFVQDLTPLFFAKTGAQVRMSPQERLEAWMAVANMERLAVGDKVRWGALLMSELTPRKSKAQHFWALSRLGARALLYGPADRVIPPETAQEWIGLLLQRQWSNPNPVAAAVAQMARKTGDRVRDLDAAAVAGVLAWMRASGAPGDQVQLLDEAVPIAAGEKSVIFGESLPAGLILVE